MIKSIENTASLSDSEKRKCNLLKYETFVMLSEFSKKISIETDKILTFILIWFALLIFNPTNAQTIQLLSNDSTPLPFAHLIITDKQGQKIALQSDKNGNAKIADSTKLKTPPFVLQVSFIGYKVFADTANSLKAFTTNPIVMQKDRVQLDQVVVTAQYAQSTVDNSIHKVKVITQKRMEAQGAVSLRDVLAQETNIRLSQDNILGSSMSMQGVSGQNVKILIDGVPIIGRLNGNVDLSQINMNDIERIEVVEGPLSVNYGTDALAGTINLITKKKQNQKVNLNLNSYYETVGQYNIDASAGVKIKKQLLTVSGGRYYFDGWKKSDPFIQFPKETLADTNRVQQWKPKEQYFAKAQMVLKRGKVNLRPYTEFYQETISNRGMPRLPYYETALDEQYFTNRINAGIDANSKLGKFGYVKVIGAYNHYLRRKNVYYTDLTTLNKRLTETTGDQDTSRFNTFMSRGSYAHKNDSSKLSFELGYDINLETAEGKRLENKTKEQGDYAFFGSLEWRPIKNLTLKPGLRAGYNTVYKNPVIPSFNALYKQNNFSYRASYARGFRAPGLKELYYEFVDINHNIVGNENLKAEESNNFTASVQWKQLRGKSLYKIGVDGFYNDIYNMISLAQIENSTGYTYQNIGRYKTTGFNVNSDFIRKSFKLTLGGSYIGRYNQVSENTDVNPFSFSPEIRSSFTYKLAKLNTSISVFYKYNGEMPNFRVNTNNEVTQTVLNDYHMLDVSATRKFWKKRLTWTLGAKNLLNVQNVGINGTGGDGAHSSGSGSTPVAWGTTLFTSLKFNFAWNKKSNP